MLLPRRLNKPYYVLRPVWTVRWVLARRGRNPTEAVSVELPWGLEMTARGGEVITGRLVRRGMYDMPLTESVCRLVDPGDLVVDVGANIGYVAGLAAVVSGSGGRVIAFEPHPVVREELLRHVDEWKGDGRLATIEVRSEAASESRGRAVLHDVLMQWNIGSASLEPEWGGGGAGHEVETAPLDEILGPEARVGVLKVDVEGHELGVFRGATELLSTHRVRDIIFEGTKDQFPTPVTELLESHGFTLFGLGQTLTRPVLTRNGDPAPREPGDEEVNFLATADPDRATRRFAARGWQSLRSRSF